MSSAILQNKQTRLFVYVKVEKNAGKTNSCFSQIKNTTHEKQIILKGITPKKISIQDQH